MSFWANLFEAAAAGAKAKAEDAARSGGRKKNKDVDCTPCAANARVEAYRAAAGAGVKKKRAR